MAQRAQVTTIYTDFGTVCLKRGDVLGRGAYGQVCKATLDELPCAAKLLFSILVDPSNPRNLRNFEQECRLLKEIRHPNVVQYLGVAQDGETGLPVLLMELMDDSLTHFLEQSEGPLAYRVQVNISHDIALAVAFLHSKRIIHRDLSSNNVLLIGAGSRAKVADFGMSKLDSHMTNLTKCPGTQVYMAPEALLDPPVYTEKLDCFQMGVLMIQVITRKFPDPGPATNRVRDARYPTGWANVPLPEVERRQNHLSLIPQTHPMLHIAVDCLKDTDSERPSAQQICRDLSALKEKPEGDNSSDYYDILLLGRTGMGKSTTGNKLLGISSEGCGPIRLWSTGEDAVKYFKAGDGYELVTNECKLLSNTHGIRVLDTPGFSDFELTKSVGVMQSNLQVLRWILRMQMKHDLVFHRVLYFLPIRGCLDRADGTLQEEIKVMYEFLGMNVFNNMVIIATNPKGKYQMVGFDEGDIMQTESVFIAAFRKIIDQHLPKCPPVLYLPFDEADIMVKINSAAVIHERPIKAQIFDVLKRSEIDTVIHNNSGRWPYFRVSCNRCTGKLICETSFLTGKEATMIGYEGENGVLMTRSKCHPIMIPKHRAVSKIVGGIAHVATLGIPAIIGEATGNKMWPGFANSDAYCPVCGQPPGSYGCTDVGEEVEIKGTCITVSHSTFIDEIVETDFSFYN